MPPLQSRVTAKGRTSIPAKIRRKLGIVPGSILEWEVDGNKVIVRRAGRYSFEDIHRALFPKPPKPRTLEELREGVAQYMRERHPRR